MVLHETLPLDEAAEASANGMGQLTPAETAEVIWDTFVKPAKEKFSRFADPRAEAIRILRDRLERVLQPVDEDEVWHGVNVVTAKDLEAAIALDLPPTSIFSAAARTPAFVYVSAVCPVCSIVSEIDLEVGAQLVVEGHSRKLKLKAKATTKPHQCGQERLDDLTPSRPIQVTLDEVEADAGDVDMGEGAANADSDDGSPDEDPEVVDRDAVHTLARVKPPADEPDDLSDLPF